MLYDALQRLFDCNQMGLVTTSGQTRGREATREKGEEGGKKGGKEKIVERLVVSGRQGSNPKQEEREGRVKNDKNGFLSSR